VQIEYDEIFLEQSTNKAEIVPYLGGKTGQGAEILSTANSIQQFHPSRGGKYKCLLEGGRSYDLNFILKFLQANLFLKQMAHSIFKHFHLIRI